MLSLTTQILGHLAHKPSTILMLSKNCLSIVLMAHSSQNTQANLVTVSVYQSAPLGQTVLVSILGHTVRVLTVRLARPHLYLDLVVLTTRFMSLLLTKTERLVERLAL